MNRQNLFWAFCAVAWYGAITYWSTLGTTETPLYGVSDFIRHACVFGLLAFFICMALYHWVAPLSLTFVLVAFLGLVDEWHQSFVPTRGFDPMDLVADMVGATLVLAGLVVANSLVTRFWKISWKGC